MIQAVIFDLDGTLVQTERLKALSYVRAAMELVPDSLTEARVIEAFKDVVGRSREEVALALMERFNLEAAARARMAEFGVGEPWQVFVQIRLRIYDTMLADPWLVLAHQCPYNTALLQLARRSGYTTGLGTMSHRREAYRVLELINLQNEFDLIATREDVERAKPDPEIYLLLSRELGLPPSHCLVIEDSLSGVKAALAARMRCIAVTTDLTREAIHTARVLNKPWIVDDPAQLETVFRHMIGEGLQKSPNPHYS